MLVTGLRAALRMTSSSGASTSSAAAAAFGTYKDNSRDQGSRDQGSRDQSSKEQGNNQWRERRHIAGEQRQPRSRHASHNARAHKGSSSVQSQEEAPKAQKSANSLAPDDAWGQILACCEHSPQKLKTVVGDLHHHCIHTQTSPPLKAFNELLRLCYHWGARASVFQLMEVMERNQMQIDEETQQRLRECFSYFPKPME